MIARESNITHADAMLELMDMELDKMVCMTPKRPTEYDVAGRKRTQSTNSFDIFQIKKHHAIKARTQEETAEWLEMAGPVHEEWEPEKTTTKRMTPKKKWTKICLNLVKRASNTHTHTRAVMDCNDREYGISYVQCLSGRQRSQKSKKIQSVKVTDKIQCQTIN